MARTKDIVAIGTPIAFVVVAAILGMRRPPEKKPKPDKILVVCSYESDDDSTLAFVVPGRDCAACRRHPLYAKVASSPGSELVGCYRQIQKGEDDELSLGAEGEPRWSEAEREARRCDGLSPRNACVDLKTLSFACRRECHRDPDCLSLCRSRCDTSRCGTPHKTEHEGRGDDRRAVAAAR